MRRGGARGAVAALVVCMCSATLGQTTDSGDEQPDPPPPKPLPWRLIASRYFASEGGEGTDLHLRWRREDRTAWMGVYSAQGFGPQWRLGGEQEGDLNKALALQWSASLQVASTGFVGGAGGLTLGKSWFMELGLSRTNLKPYFNQNFDPGDAVTLGVGWHDDKAGAVALTLVRDNRLGTGQQDLHLNLQKVLRAGARVTLDMMDKRGREDDGREVHVVGATVTWDSRLWLLRIAYDPQQNFGPANVLRVSVGIGF